MAKARKVPKDRVKALQYIREIFNRDGMQSVKGEAFNDSDTRILDQVILQLTVERNQKLNQERERRLKQRSIGKKALKGFTTADLHEVLTILFNPENTKSPIDRGIILIEEGTSVLLAEIDEKLNKLRSRIHQETHPEEY